MKKIFNVKVIHNKKNNQANISLPRKKLKFLKKKIPKELKIEIKGIKW